MKATVSTHRATRHPSYTSILPTPIKCVLTRNNHSLDAHFIIYPAAVQEGVFVLDHIDVDDKVYRVDKVASHIRDPALRVSSLPGSRFINFYARLVQPAGYEQSHQTISRTPPSALYRARCQIPFFGWKWRTFPLRIERIASNYVSPRTTLLRRRLANLTDHLRGLGRDKPDYTVYLAYLSVKAHDYIFGSKRLAERIFGGSICSGSAAPPLYSPHILLQPFRALAAHHKPSRCSATPPSLPLSPPAPLWQSQTALATSSPPQAQPQRRNSSSDRSYLAARPAASTSSPTALPRFPMARSAKAADRVIST